MSNTALVPEKIHAELGASSASRWMACPGSVQLSRGLPDNETDFAREGTAAHALAELALRKGVPTDTFVGTVLEGVEVTEEMAEFVEVFVAHCRYLHGFCDETFIEQKFSLAQLNPPAPMFGTADFCAYAADERMLFVSDLKYGAGVRVEVKGNKQLRYYALGAALALGAGRPIDTVCITVVQPRVAHPDGVVRSEEISITELLDFSGELMSAARATLRPDAPLVSGSHCRFCKAAGRCPEQMKAAQVVAQVEFADVPLDLPPAPELLPTPVLVEMLDKLHILEDWAASMRAHAKRILEDGGDLPGWKLVEKRATRKWANESETRKHLQEKGYADEEIEKRELKSPAQIEKLLKAGKEKLPAELVVKISSGYNMARSDDARPAASINTGEEFAALPPASE